MRDFIRKRASGFLDWLLTSRRELFQLGWLHAERDILDIKDQLDMVQDCGGLVYLASYLGSGLIGDDDDDEFDYEQYDISSDYRPGGLALTHSCYLRGYKAACEHFLEGEKGRIDFIDLTDNHQLRHGDLYREMHLGFFADAIREEAKAPEPKVRA